MDDSTLRLCGDELREIAGSLASIRALLEDPDNPLLQNNLAVIEPAMLQLERQLISIAKTLLNHQNPE